jgi:hypothetical protein
VHLRGPLDLEVDLVDLLEKWAVCDPCALLAVVSACFSVFVSLRKDLARSMHNTV